MVMETENMTPTDFIRNDPKLFLMDRIGIYKERVNALESIIEQYPGVGSGRVDVDQVQASIYRETIQEFQHLLNLLEKNG